MTIVGVESRGLPSPGGSVPFRAVLVLGEANDLACYVGSGDVVFVADQGDKVSLQEAKIYFPFLVEHMRVHGMTYRGPGGQVLARMEESQ